MATITQTSRQPSLELFSKDILAMMGTASKDVQNSLRDIHNSLVAFKTEEKNTHSLVKRYSPELAEANKGEVAFLTEQTIQTLNTISKIKDKALRKEKIDDLHNEISDPEGDGKVQRLIDGQNARTKEMLKNGVKPFTPQYVSFDKVFCPKDINVEKLQRASDNFKVESVSVPLSKNFIDAYALYLALFPRDETDTFPKLMAFCNKYADGAVTKNSLGEREYTRHIMLAAKDDKGKVVAIGLGVFIAGAEINEFYLSHIAVLPEYRKSDVATLIETSMISECNKYAKDAEKKLGVSYPLDKNGNKMMYAVIEIDFPSLRPSEIVDTWGRLIYHGKNGTYIIPSMRYLQPDTTYPDGKAYNENDYAPVPLLFSVIPVGDRSVIAKTATQLLRSMEESFKALGNNAEGIEADIKYATEKLNAMDPSAIVPMTHLPRNVEEIKDLIRKLGDADKILEDSYSKYPQEASSEEKLSVDNAALLFLANRGISVHSVVT